MDSADDQRPVVDAELVQAVGAALGVEVDEWRDLGGSWTANVILGSREPALVARIHRRTTPYARVAAEQQVRELLAAGGVPTVRADGLTVLGGSRRTRGLLLEHESYVPATDRMKTADRLVTGASMLARIHDVLRSRPLPAAAQTTVHANYVEEGEVRMLTERGATRVRSWRDPELTAAADAIVRHLDLVDQRTRRLDAELASQVVHGDFWDNNVLFAGGQVAAVLDFGSMGVRRRIDDLALPFWFWLLEPGRGRPEASDLDLLDAMADAYDTAATEPLSPAERAVLPLVAAGQLGWSLGRWVLQLPPSAARQHLREAATELPFAERLLAVVRGFTS